MNPNYDPTQAPPQNPWNAPSGNLQHQPSFPGDADRMNYALWADRVLAALIDAGVALGFMIALYVVLALATTVLAGVLSAISPDLGALLSCGGCLMWFILPPLSYLIVGLLNKVYWVSTRGYSIGQGIMKLKVVDVHGSLVPMGTAVLRLFVTIGLSFIPFFGSLLDLLFPLFDEPTRQTLHDKAVGTFVIKVQQ